MPHTPPQPAVDRLTPFGNSAIVVGISPSLPDLVAVTACSLAAAIGSPCIYFAYSDASRYVVEEYDDGTVKLTGSVVIASIQFGGDVKTKNSNDFSFVALDVAASTYTAP